MKETELDETGYEVPEADGWEMTKEEWSTMDTCFNVIIVTLETVFNMIPKRTTTTMNGCYIAWCGSI